MQRVYKTLKQLMEPIKRKKGWYRQPDTPVEVWEYQFEDSEEK